MEGVVDVDDSVNGVDDDEVMEEEVDDGVAATAAAAAATATVGVEGVEVEEDEEDFEEGGRRSSRSRIGSSSGGGKVTVIRKRSSSSRSQGNLVSNSKRMRMLKHGMMLSSSSMMAATTKRTSAKTRSVVKLSVTRVLPSYSEPWRKSPQSSSSGTGFLVSNKRIVTNAHVVKRASTVRARASASPVVVSCVVEWISVPLDLAVLKILDEDAFFGSSDDDNEIKDDSGKDSSSSAAAADGGEKKTDGGDDAKKDKESAASAKHPPLSLCTDLPRLDENVTCVGFPQGGTQISVTRGVVSRIDVNPMNGVLRIQIDAAINPGNSGGPVFDEHGRVVGVASSHFRGASNIGYIIPGRVVQHFLNMCEDGLEASAEERSVLGDVRFHWGTSDDNNEEDEKVLQEPKVVPGIAHLGIYGSQNLEGKALRKRLGLKAENKSGGVRVVGVKQMGDLEEEEEESANGDTKKISTEEASSDALTTTNNNTSLLVDDVILTINSSPVGQDGTVILSPSRPDERIHYLSLVTKHRIGAVINLSVLRNAKLQTVNVKLSPNRYIVPKYDGLDAYPSYVVVGGCVFVPLSAPYIQSTAKKRSTGRVAPFDRYASLQQTKKGGTKQILILSKVLADEINVGYHGLGLVVLKSVNGVDVENLRDLVACLVSLAQKNIVKKKEDDEKEEKDDKKEDNNEDEEEVVEFRLYPANLETAEYVVCLNLKDVLQSERRIMDRHMIASWCSADAIPIEMRNKNGTTKTDSDAASRRGVITGEYWKSLRMLSEEVFRRETMERAS